MTDGFGRRLTHTSNIFTGVITSIQQSILELYLCFLCAFFLVFLFFLQQPAGVMLYHGIFSVMVVAEGFSSSSSSAFVCLF